MSKYHIKTDASASTTIDSYLEYSRIVRDDDKGVTFSPDQYEAYKRRIIPMRIKNRLYVCWINEADMDCKLIGPETQCFCGHRYHQHKTDFDQLPLERPVSQPCEVSGCPCNSYHYTPMVGKKFVFCSCRHGPKDHNPSNPFLCEKSKCSCEGFSTKFVCGCGQKASTHRMITETCDERLLRGHPVSRDTPYKAMGGITGFSSLMEGYLRLDSSGKGVPDDDVTGLPITSSDHPFLRANVNSIRANKLSMGAPDTEDDMAERISATKKAGESDMEYYERRYQERAKAQRLALRGPQKAINSGYRSTIKPFGATTHAGTMGIEGLSLSGISCEASSSHKKGQPLRSKPK